MFQVSFGEKDLKHWINAEIDDHAQKLGRYLRNEHQTYIYTPGFFYHEYFLLVVRKELHLALQFRRGLSTYHGESAEDAITRLAVDSPGSESRAKARDALTALARSRQDRDEARGSWSPDNGDSDDEESAEELGNEGQPPTSQFGDPESYTLAPYFNEPLRRCQEWVNEVIQALVTEQILGNPTATESRIVIGGGRDESR